MNEKLKLTMGGVEIFLGKRDVEENITRMSLILIGAIALPLRGKRKTNQSSPPLQALGVRRWREA